MTPKSAVPAKTTDERLLEAVKAAADQTLLKRIYALNQRVSVLESQRDEWKTRALQYRNQLLENL